MKQYPLLRPLKAATAEAWGFQAGEARRLLADGSFELRLTVVPEDQVLEVAVYDAETREPYYPFGAASATGPVVTQLRAEVDELVNQLLGQQVAENPVLVRVGEYVQARYGVASRAPFARHPEVVGWDHPAKQKLFALAIPVAYQRLDRTSDRSDEVLVLNLKGDPDRIPTLVDGQAIFPAYHMNKKHWFSVLLDSQTDETALKAHIDRSYALVGGQK